MRKTGLWLARHRDANAWYHIYPFAMSPYTKILHVVRHRKVPSNIPNIKYHTYNSQNLLIDLLKIFYIGFKTLLVNKIDYIVTFNPVPWGSIAWILAKIFNKPIIFGYIGADFNHYLKNTKWKYFLNYASRRSNVISVTGNNMIKYFTNLGIHRNNIFVYPHCVREEWFNNKHLLVQKEYDIITVCNLIPRKRVQDIILAVEQLHLKGMQIKCCIVGDGPEMLFLKRLVNKKNLEQQIVFTGWQENVIEYLSKSKIYVQASISEGFSISLIEAIVLGLVPIITKAGSEEDYIVNGENGFFFSVGNYSELSNKIELTLKNGNYNMLRKNVLILRNNFNVKNAITVCNNILNYIFTNNNG